jgi:hypothetical protein
MMKAISLIGSVAGVLMAITQAGAATYTYTGIPSNGGTFVIPGDPSSGVNQYYVSATVDLSCGASCSSGTYTEGGNLTSFSLSIDGPTPSSAPVFSISSSDPNYIGSADPNLFGTPSYVTLSNVGGVITITNWSVYADLGPDPLFLQNFTIYTLNDPTNGTSDLYADYPPISNGSGNFDMAGIWTGPGIAAVSATPLPSTWTMLIAGFVGFGFLTYRGTKKSSPALAAA